VISGHLASLGGTSLKDKNLLYALDRQFEIRLKEFLSWKKTTINAANYNHHPDFLK